MAYKFEIYKSSADGQFYWRFKSGNGEIMAVSEGYTTKSNANKAVTTIKASAAGATVDDLA